jgi:hypothetical protein
MFDNAINLYRKSGVAQWRDLWFPSPPNNFPGTNSPRLSL